MFLLTLRHGEEEEHRVEYIDLMCDENGPWCLLAPEASGFLAHVPVSKADPWQTRQTTIAEQAEEELNTFHLKLFSRTGQEPYLHISFNVELKGEWVVEA